MASTYLTRTPSSGGNRKTFTISAWFKKCKLSSNQILVQAATDGSTRSQITLRSDDMLEFYSENGGVQKINVRTNRVLRDTNAWYHVVLAVDTTQATASNRVKIYINGTQETSLHTAVYGDQNYDTQFNHTVAHTIGRRDAYSDQYFDGYQSHFSLVDGTALTPTTFGQTDSTSGIWKFKSPSGVTWGTNGVHLKFENSAALGTDSSGQSNTYTVNGNLKQALDTPSNVYCTMNPLSTTQNFNLSNGNNTFGAAADNKYITGNLGGDSEAASTGYYFEYKVNANNLGNSGEGFRVGVKSVENIFASDNDWYGLQETASDLIYEKTNGSSTTDTNIGSASNGDVVMIAWGKGGKIWMGVNGVWVDSGNPSSGSGEQYSGLTGVYAPFIMCSLTNGMNGSSMNFGNGFFGTTAITSAGSNGNGSLFEYDVPSGYYALNTKNINTYG